MALVHLNRSAETSTRPYIETYKDQRRFAVAKNLPGESVNVADTRIENIHTGESYAIITTLEPPVYVKNSIFALLERVDDSFVARFAAANVNASGETEAEAIQNLKYLITDIFLDLDALPKEQLGHAVQRQIESLRRFVGKREHDR